MKDFTLPTPSEVKYQDQDTNQLMRKLAKIKLQISKRVFKFEPEPSWKLTDELQEIVGKSGWKIETKCKDDGYFTWELKPV